MKWLLLLVSLFTLHLFSKQTTLLLVRHGETDWNLQWKVQGQTDIPLNETGIKQAKEVGQMIIENHSDINAIYASDLTRAVQTANETAQYFGFKVKTSSSLREMNCGIAEGMKIKDKIKIYGEAFYSLDEKYKTRKERWEHSCVPGEETLNQLLNRARSELLKLAKKHLDEKVAVFAHSKTIGVVIADILDTKALPRIKNCSVYEIIYDDVSDNFFYSNQR